MLLTPLGPIALSFDKKVHFVAKWKWALLAAVIVAIPYLIWDEVFTVYEFWGFNPDYLVDVYIGNLPIEEISFFLVVPFACTFIYACLEYYAKNANLKTFNLIFYVLFFAYMIWVGEVGVQGWYTRIAISLGLLLTLYLFIKREKFRFIPLTFLFAMLPFLLVNGVLTGSFLESPIVWYNEVEFSGMRLFTIPLEDVVYGFGLIVLNILLFRFFLSLGLRAKSRSSS
ncbi:MAG: lycopene cyclase domain-containing protein [Arenicella sp.]|jgi:lycopene cyclase domain-containing protein